MQIGRGERACKIDFYFFSGKFSLEAGEKIRPISGLLRIMRAEVSRSKEKEVDHIALYTMQVPDYMNKYPSSSYDKLHHSIFLQKKYVYLIQIFFNVPRNIPRSGLCTLYEEIKSKECERNKIGNFILSACLLLF